MVKNKVKNKKHRNDINGIRAIAIIAIIAFHSGYLPSGFLGVDIFLVISGFFITKLIYQQINNNHFSLIAFYLGRIRRIVPLTLFVGLISLVIGSVTMLPDDMENLAQSVIATNFFSNNILQAITTKDYWDVVNEFKPLMHTWFLGVLGQYYLIYPFLLMIIMKTRPTWLLSILSICGSVSIALYLLPFYAEHEKFYSFFFRFWEFAAGGVAAIVIQDKLIEHKYSVLLILLLVSLLLFDCLSNINEIRLLITVLLTVAILVTSNKNRYFAKFLIENKLFVAIGKISFGLYLWHQVLLAYARYFWVHELYATSLCAIYILTIILSLFSYFIIEKPFINKDRINNRMLLGVTGFVFAITTTASVYIYLNAGVLRDIPELGIHKTEVVRNMHAEYNHRIYKYDKNFSSPDRTNVLIIGNSFARDWANVLMESKYSDKIEISYIYSPYSHKDFKNRVTGADIIFYSTPKIHEIFELGIPKTKLWAIGTKNFGTSNGIYYNYNGSDYYLQKTPIEKKYLEQNELLRNVWGNRYLDYIEKVIDNNKKVPVFTQSNQFISQDCRHLTKAGAQYFAQLFEQDLKPIFSYDK